MDGNPNPVATSSSGSVSTGNAGRKRSGNLSDSDEEDTESESSSSSSRALRGFRKEWQSELKESSSSAKTTDSTTNAKDSTISPAEQQHAFKAPAPSDVEEEAKNLFLMGVGLERQGDLYDAVRHYRRAMQLVPDIEYRVNQNETPANETNSQNDSDSEHEHEYQPDPEDDLDYDGDLKTKFLKTIEANGWKFFEKKHSDTKVHLNNIPVEVLTYILRWLISDELDLRSLDIVSRVSKGFYCLCRDEELWKMACERVWNKTDGFSGSTLSTFSSYREMFLCRPRLRFEGCYISKVSYVRPGEHSFQDHSYRPWHLVEYYRYLRFFPDGTLHFLTTSEQPANTVSGLRDHTPRNPATLQGEYKIVYDNFITARVDAKQPSANYNSRAGKSKQKTQSSSLRTTFHMAFQVEKLRGRPNWVLNWNSHSVVLITKTGVEPDVVVEIRSKFEITHNKYPPLYFSRVKSYTSKSENILEPPPLDKSETD